MDYEQQITLPNDVAAVPRLAEFIDQACEAAGLDMGITMQMNLAAEEAVVNVMSYAYPQGTKGDIEISLRITDSNLTDELRNPNSASRIFTLTIKDSGVPFDPTAKADADTTLSAEERSIGGLGIHLVRQLMDDISYERTADGKNILTMRRIMSEE
ncbi:MAG: ATP-binding protein [Prevotella sp.]|nr:ATP-binding protein [Prevotella sp.]